jgi:hypothetical protein
VSPKIRRSAFLYLQPDSTDHLFAQCGICRAVNNSRCMMMDREPISPTLGSCGFFFKGPSVGDHVLAKFTKTQVGYSERKVRCENCVFVRNKGTWCNLFKQLNETMPNVFDLDWHVKPTGCCNAQTEK